MADAGARRDDAEVRKRLLAPLQKLVAFHIALKLKLDIVLESAGGAGLVNHHRVVDDQIDGCQRIDLVRIAAHGNHCIAHRRKIDHGRDAGEILHQNTRRQIGDLVIGGAGVEPLADSLDVVGRDGAAVFPAHQIFQHDFQ